MRKKLIKATQTVLTSAIILAIAVPAMAYRSPPHRFTQRDVMGGFDGTTVSTTFFKQEFYNTVLLRPSILCGTASSGVPCPADSQPLIDKDGTVLYPIDSQFGFNVVDFLGAEEKDYNGDYKEGFAGDIIRDGLKVGLRVSNASTDVYKVPAGLGTWCQGLGGTSVKCSTEHYTVMEHVLSCFETIPYRNADPVTGVQAVKAFPSGTSSYDCANAQLNDIVNIIGGELDGTRLTDSTPGVQIEANDNTTIQNDIAASSDYSVTLKDDGKALYRWGTLIKRPNDIRLYAKLPLPEEWKEPEADFPVMSAKLVVRHLVTNNPNDQLRPEDLENEAAIGRLPSYEVDSSNPAGDVWKSLKTCYEGDGDLIDIDGSADPTLIPAGTVFKNEPFSLPSDPANLDEPLPFSADLTEGFTNGWYTTVDREPFEWSYRKLGTPANVYDFVSSATPNPALGELYSGPRWRLKPNKFGQDIPGLEIPLNECTPPPYANDNIKYDVGTPVVTVINLLDWDEEANGPSPLATSKGWVDVTQNGSVTVAQTIAGFPISTNGLPMTNDFDLAVYIKGDKKPTSIYSAQLFINQEPAPWHLAPYIDPLAGGNGGGSNSEIIANPDINIINGF